MKIVMGGYCCMVSYNYLLDLALILLSTKFLGIITKRFKMPQVVGALLAGLILGPALFNILKENPYQLANDIDGIGFKIADDIAAEVNNARAAKGIAGECRAFIADPPMADEMLPEVKVGGIPEFERRTLFHALNSRAMVRRYARSVGKSNKEVTVIVAHMGGGSSVSLHRNGLVIDTTDALGGDGPISPERAGTVPGFPLVEMCFSGKYSKDEIKKKLVGKGGAVAYFGTNDIREVAARAEAGDAQCEVFLKGFAVSVAKYIASMAVVVDGKVDAIVLTGGIANSKAITDDISRRVGFIAPVEVYPGENELESLAENGYGILAGEFEIGTYHRDRF